MHPNSQSVLRQRGNMVVIAIFVMVVMSLLGLTMMKMLTATNRSVVFEVLGARANLAAKSGLQHIASTAFPLNSDALECNSTLSSPTQFSISPGFEGCTYTAQCATETFNKDGVAYFYYRFSATGICEAGDIVTSRTVSVDASQEQ